MMKTPPVIEQMARVSPPEHVILMPRQAAGMP